MKIQPTDRMIETARRLAEITGKPTPEALKEVMGTPTAIVDDERGRPCVWQPRSMDAPNIYGDPSTVMQLTKEIRRAHAELGFRSADIVTTFAHGWEVPTDLILRSLKDDDCIIALINRHCTPLDPSLFVDFAEQREAAHHEKQKRDIEQEHRELQQMLVPLDAVEHSDQPWHVVLGYSRGRIPVSVNLMDLRSQDIARIGLCGKVGTGKSVLTDYVFDQITDQGQGEAIVTIADYLSRRGDDSVWRIVLATDDDDPDVVRSIAREIRSHHALLWYEGQPDLDVASSLDATYELISTDSGVGYLRYRDALHREQLVCVPRIDEEFRRKIRPWRDKAEH